MTLPDYLDRPNLPRLAYHKTDGDGPTVIFCGGFRSDMTGTKATFLETQCRARGQAFVRFDYRAHGQSAGDFNACTLSGWRDDTLDVIDRLTSGDVIIVGSSMGGWLALLAALARPDRVKGFVGIAAAPDFTRDVRAEMEPTQLAALQRDGFIDVPSEYSAEPYRLSRALLDDGDRLALLDKPFALPGPARLFHGRQDTDVPWQKCLKLAEMITGDVAVHLIADGDHRLSRQQDLAMIDEAVAKLSGADLIRVRDQRLNFRF